MPEYLTTREVADLLRIKERKVYELVGENAIPVSRVTGKLLFPKKMIEAWVRRHTEYRDATEGLGAHPQVLAGSHDPLLEWALRESGSGVATYFDGSLVGLERMAAGEALAAGVHLFEPERADWNVDHVQRFLAAMPVVLLQWAWRNQGLILAAGNPLEVASIRDVAELRMIPRQAQSGSHRLLEHLLRAEQLNPESISWVAPCARSEADVAMVVCDGKADAGFGIEAVARQFRLHFVPLFRERYDLVVWRRDYFEPEFQRLLDFARAPAFGLRARELGGYDLSDTGRVLYNSP